MFFWNFPKFGKKKLGTAKVQLQPNFIGLPPSVANEYFLVDQGNIKIRRIKSRVATSVFYMRLMYA